MKKSRVAPIFLLAITTAPAAYAQVSVPPVTPGGASVGQPIDAPRQIEREENMAVQPVGGRIGAFKIYPQLDAAIAYDDNVYALENKTDDVVGRLSPKVRIVGDMRPYKLTISGGADLIRFKDRDTENRTDWNVDARHELELAERTLLRAGASYRRRHEDRGDPNFTSTNRKPNAYSVTSANAEIGRDVARFRAGLRANYSKFDYRDATQIGGGITNNDDRDREEYLAELRLGYEFSRGYALVTRLAYEKTDYRLPLDDGGFNRASKGLRAFGGVAFELSRLLLGELTLGYIHRTYEDPRFSNANRFSYNAQLEWYPTELTSVQFIANRLAQETVAVGYSSYIASTFSVRVEHELTRTITLSAAARYIENDYQVDRVVTTPDRTEKYYGVAFGVRYDVNRNFYTFLGYDWNKRTSTATVRGSEFTRNKIGLTVGARL